MILIFAFIAVAFAAPKPKADVIAYPAYSPYYATYPYTSYSNVYTYPSVYSPSVYGGLYFS